ncbi:DUF7144 family membrane protein [Nocardia higoensis]|uniref:DUF7144 family membrane protein n=1 Tax=Nocardia higoensis TaxID=228599 RepID=UPI0005925CE9|nr:hypothetical protein [Nocardia higoensis]
MTYRPETREAPPAEPMQKQGIATGISLVAAIMLMVLGALSILEGTVAISGDEIYVAGVDYIYAFDTTTWGWIHVILGVIGLVCGAGLLFGTRWGRYAAIVIAALVMIANFLSLPYYPAWSLLVIALSIVVVWAVATWQPQG